jgi:hypothetical protein
MSEFALNGYFHLGMLSYFGGVDRHRMCLPVIEDSFPECFDFNDPVLLENIDFESSFQCHLLTSEQESPIWNGIAGQDPLNMRLAVSSGNHVSSSSSRRIVAMRMVHGRSPEGGLGIPSSPRTAWSPKVGVEHQLRLESQNRRVDRRRAR